jgi:hypothetical protein
MWSTDVYRDAKAARVASGRSAFDYSDTTRTRVARSEWKVHETLDPAKAGLRESRDSDEHPESLAIAVLFDVTGSMRSVPMRLQEKLPELFGLLLRKGYVAHPQIMFGAIGDATCDRVPLQVGQFESDNRMENDLGNIMLEGGGGGQQTESYELAMYYMARHTALDCLEKRGKKGYLFIIGDEMAYPRVSARQVRDVIGDEQMAHISVEEMVAELKEKYEVFYILPAGASHAGSVTILDFWRDLLGQNVLELEDLDAVCETIALTIGIAEDAIDLDEGLDHLAEIGSDAVGVVGKALAKVGGGGALATGDGPVVLDSDDDSVTRL